MAKVHKYKQCTKHLNVKLYHFQSYAKSKEVIIDKTSLCTNVGISLKESIGMINSKIEPMLHTVPRGSIILSGGALVSTLVTGGTETPLGWQTEQLEFSLALLMCQKQLERHQVSFPASLDDHLHSLFYLLSSILKTPLTEPAWLLSIVVSYYYWNKQVK